MQKNANKRRNPAAAAVRSHLYRPKVVKSKKLYSRKGVKVDL